MRIRRARLEDAGALAALSITVWVDTYASRGLPRAWADYLATAYTKEGMEAALVDSARALWVAEAEDGLAAFAEMNYASGTPQLGDSRQAEVVHLYVLGRFSRHGLGRALLRACADEAATRGVEVLWLSAYAENAGALAFYRAQGWREIGSTFFELGGVRYPNLVFARYGSKAGSQNS